MNWKLILIFVMLCMLSASSAEEWFSEEILNHSGIGSDCDLIIDETGGLHICFHFESNTIPGSNLYYANKADSVASWEITPVDVQNFDFVGDDCEIDLDSNENPHISYLFEIDYEYLPYVKYAALNGTSWQTEQITSYPQWAGPGTSLFLDSTDNSHIFYPRYGELVYHWNDGTDGWNSETLESGYMFSYPHAAGDLSGNIGVAYFYLSSQTADRELHYAYNDGSIWSVETAFNDNPCVSTWQLDMVYDHDGYPHITYVAATETDDLSMLLHTWFDGTVWNTDNLGSSATGVYTFPSIAVDDSNAVHISYSLRASGSGNGVLHHISDESDTWVDVIVKDGINSWNTAIDIAPDNQPHIIYYNYTGGITSHAWRTGGTGIEGASINTAPTISIAPNPFRSSSVITININSVNPVLLDVFDLSGRLIETLAEEQVDSGLQNYILDAKDLTPGIYLIRLQTGDIITTQRCILVR